MAPRPKRPRKPRVKKPKVPRAHKPKKLGHVRGSKAGVKKVINRTTGF